MNTFIACIRAGHSHNLNLGPLATPKSWKAAQHPGFPRNKQSLENWHKLVFYTKVAGRNMEMISSNIYVYIKI